MDISVVIPVYDEAAILPELYRELSTTLDRLPPRDCRCPILLALLPIRLRPRPRSQPPNGC